MKPIIKLARELPGQNGPYSIRLKVIEKKDVQTSQGNQALRYQHLMFQDEEGTRLQSILYNNSLAELENTLENEMEYVITNAKVKMLPAANTADKDAQAYELLFNANTIVDRIPYQPKYVPLASIPKKVLLSDRYDVLGIVIYVDPTCQITRPNGQTRDVCEVIIVDQSYEQVMVITAWENEAIEECRRIQTIALSFPVIGFTALKSAHRKGFSMAVTPKTSISWDPKGAEADRLRAWGEANHALLAEKSYQVFKVRCPTIGRNIITVEQLLQKKARDTLQEEQHWLNVHLSEFTTPHLTLYHGCSNCGTGNYECMGAVYNSRECLIEDVISSPRYDCVLIDLVDNLTQRPDTANLAQRGMTLTFEVADETGTYVLEAPTAEAEIILDVAVTDLYPMLPREKEDYLRQIVRHLTDTLFYVQVSPSALLSTKHELVWVLQQVSLT